MATNRSNAQVHDRYLQLQQMGWTSSQIGKPPLHSYMLEKEGEDKTYKSNTLGGLLDKVEHIKPEKELAKA